MKPITEKKKKDQTFLFPVDDRFLNNPFAFGLLEEQSPLADPKVAVGPAQNNFMSETHIPQTGHDRKETGQENPKTDPGLMLADVPSETADQIPESHGVTTEEGNEKDIFPEYLKQPIWLVEKTKDAETYSNGLQIITAYKVKNISRNYVVFSRNEDVLPGPDAFSHRIRGILYHTSEGDMAPFKPEKNKLLKKFSNQLVHYVRRKKGYHYLIDRFGRVYRIVRDEDAAFHAGNAVWADEDSIFLNLNHAFLGICFEGKDFEEILEPGSTRPKIRVMDRSTITEAQIQSGKELTDWLRYHYQIPQHNCIAHGIASVYPKNRLVGYHLDLAHGFPFHRFGLQDKYGELIPSIIEFGFKRDRYFNEVLNGNVWPGIVRSEAFLKTAAKQKSLSLSNYRKRLNDRFDRYYSWQAHLHDNLAAAASMNKDSEANETD